MVEVAIIQGMMREINGDNHGNVFCASVSREGRKRKEAERMLIKNIELNWIQT